MLPRVNIIKCNEADYMLFSTDDAISNVLYRTGQWEEYLLTISRVFLQSVKNPLVLDIGANLGAYSIPLAKEIQDVGGAVMAFEPQRVIYYQLCGNIVLNRLDNFIAFNKAVGDFDGNIEMPEINYENNVNIGAFSLDKAYREHLNMEQFMKNETTSVPIIKLDSLNVPTAPSLIKIDVEGFELNVLKGAENFLEEYRYPPVIFEAWNLDWFMDNKVKLLNFVNYLGYEISMNIKSEIIAQHPESLTKVNFSTDGNGTIIMNRVR